ncbi:MAG: NAD(P)H-hydrate dehydratase, partial [Rhodocyclaceae bacterium]|nr:NAD(P)H-hydrate dehydratase [Rhodocyclaceae bacterium]
SMLVLDADALNLLGSNDALAALARQRRAPLVLTPHPGEAARLLNQAPEAIHNDRLAAVIALARDFNAHVVLKGCGSLIARPDGAWFINRSGNPGMSAAGMGDVLTGLLAGLLAQGWPIEQAILGAVHLHGAAADMLQAKGIGPVGMGAAELPDAARSLFNQWIAQKLRP